MSLPSISRIAKELGVDLDRKPTLEQQRQVLVGALRADFGPALELLHSKAHEAQKSPDGRAHWEEKPNEPLGKLLIRLHASDVLRPIVSQEFCHGLPLTFLNCCKGTVGKVPEDLMLAQIHSQSGHTGTPDC